MAVTVVPYNPWRENLAVNVLGGLLNNFLEQNRQAEQNRKVNAFRGQLQQDLQNNIIQGQENSALSLAQPQAPAGYDSSPWASMFHKTDSPLTQFDIGTSVIPMRDPTVQEISNTADSLGASRRFSMINPEAIQGIKAGMIQQAEAQRIRGLQDMYTQQFRNARDLASQLSIYGQALINGVAPYQGFNSLANMDVAQKDADAKRDVANTDRLAKIDVANIERDAKLGVADRDLLGRQYVADSSAEANMYGTDVSAAVQRERNDIENRKAQFEMEEARKTRALQEKFARQFGNSKTPQEQMSTLGMANIFGLGSGALSPFSSLVTSMAQPWEFSNVDIGNYKLMVASNRSTGEATPVIVSPVGMSPYQKTSLSTQREIAAMGDATAHRGYDIQEAQNQWERNNPKLERVMGNDGQIYNVNPYTGEATSLVDKDNAHIIGDDGQYKLRTELLKSIDKENEQLRRERMLLAETDEDRAIYDEKIRKNLELRKSILQPLLSQYENGVRPTTGATSSVTSNPPVTQATGQVTSLQSPFVLPVLGNTTGQDISVPSVIPMQSAQQATSTSGDVQRKKMVIKGSDLPSDIWYDPKKDSAIPPENILTREQFGRVIAGIMNNPPKGTEHLTPITIAYQLFKHRGIRVKK